MTREDSLRTKTWVPADGRYLTVNEISNNHLHNIRRTLQECTLMYRALPKGEDC